MPIFAIYVSGVKGGSIEAAASVVSVHLIARIIFELVSGRMLLNTTLTKKYLFTITGLLIIGLSFLGFALSTAVLPVYLFFAVAGMGMGIASPAKNSIFSTHLDKNKETSEWGIYDAAVFVGMALSAALGGFIAKLYGFQVLFIIASAINLVGIIPYLIFIHKTKRVI